MSGGFEYNMTTETEYQQMKQRNQQLQEENQSLKQSLQQLIKINNQLTDSMEQFNNSAVKNSKLRPEIDQQNQQLAQELEYYKNLVYSNEDKNQIISALQGLIDSFNQTQKLYEEQISNICEQLDHYKSEWEARLQNYENVYIKKLKSVDELITQLRKKQEIVSIIEKKIREQDKIQPKKRIHNFDLMKNGEVDHLDVMETNSEKKADSHGLKQSTRANINIYEKQVEALRQRQKHLTSQINNKNKIITTYGQLIKKLKKKLMEKY